ncbi:MAG: phosphatase PAP2 family protein [Rhodobacteraceae bacterium]|nr:phosphatase PAP2 family protein [Paracoccaceae bacterium]
MSVLRPAALLAAATAAAAAVFVGLPSVDLAVSGLFHDPRSGTWAGAAPWAEALRALFWKATEAAVLGFTLLLAAALARRGRALVPARLWAFALGALALGPGLLVNGILKEVWDRARPRMVVEFGGDAAFTPAWVLGGGCAQNCSFVSGEAAGTATLALVLWLIAGRRLPGRGRAVAAAGLVAATLAVGLQRVASGGHFLSDVVFAWLLPAGLTLALWRLSGADRAADRLTAAALRADIAAAAAALGRLLRGERRN